MSDSVLIEVGLNYASEVCEIITPDCKKQLINTFQKFIDNRISFEKARDIVISLVGNPVPIDKIREIISVSENPLPPVDDDDGDSGTLGPKRKKTRTWTAEEDNRLLMGVYKFGLENWNSIALFVGHSRNRSQCSQRWIRVLDPHISKAPWSDEENKKLLSLVKKYGTKMWVKVSSEMNRRSDVQCRYHYKQLTGASTNSQDSPVLTPPNNFPPTKIKQQQQQNKPTNIPIPPSKPAINIPQQTGIMATPTEPPSIQFADLTFQKLNHNHAPPPQMQTPPQQSPVNIFVQPLANPLISVQQTSFLPPRQSPIQQSPTQFVPPQITSISPPQPIQAPLPHMAFAPPQLQQQVPPPLQQRPTISSIQSLQIPLARSSNQASQSNYEAPLLLKSSGDFFKSDQLFDSSFWT